MAKPNQNIFFETDQITVKGRVGNGFAVTVRRTAPQQAGTFETVVSDDDFATADRDDLATLQPDTPIRRTNAYFTIRQFA